MMNTDILERLRLDPGKRTIGELSQDREHALHEIVKLRADIERLRTIRAPRSETADNRVPPTHRAGALIRLSDVCELVGVSRSTIYQWASEGRFPQPVHVGERAVRWRIVEIERWREAL
jgi:prophage regulatory protein